MRRCSGEAYLTQLPFFQGLYDLPGRATVNPNYDVNLLGNAAVNRCEFLATLPSQIFSLLTSFRPSISLSESLLLPGLLRLHHPTRHTCFHLPHVLEQVSGVP